MADLTPDDSARLRGLPVRVYQPTAGGGRAYAGLIERGFMTVRDAGYEQETVLICEITEAGRQALATQERPDER